MRHLLPVLALVLGVTRGVAAAPSVAIPGFALTAAVTALASPTAIAFLPDGRLLVTEKRGVLRLVDGGAVVASRSIDVCTASEMGLLGVAVDPAFTTTGAILLYRTRPGPDGCGDAAGRVNQVVRVTLAGDAFAPGAPVVLLTGMRTDGGNHDGGGLRIGPDGKLYVGVGDTGNGDNKGGPGTATNPYSQNLNALEGKILRLELDGSPASGNPFVGQAGARPEVFARGFRNPWRMSFDPVTGRLWVGDVGDLTIEEIDIVAAGGNFGWPRCEARQPGGCERPGDVLPIFSYRHDGQASLGTSITGGTFTAPSFGALGDHYVFGDFTAGDSGRLWDAIPSATRKDVAGPPTLLVDDAGGPVDVVWGPDAALYYVAYLDGEVRRLAPSCGAPGDCDDHDACTVDTCDAPNGCRHTPTTNATACADDDPCTDDTCDPDTQTGCRHVARTGIPGAACQFRSHSLDSPACANQLLPRPILRNFEAAARQTVRAQATRQPKSKRLVTRAIASLDRATAAAKRAGQRLAISFDCAATTTNRLDAIRSTLESLL